MMKSGYFNQNRLGGYTITDPDLKYSCQYNLLNDDILVRLDQDGLSYIQAAPPGGIVLLRREYGEKFSKWLTFFRCGGKTYSNFARPGTERPEKTEISFLPEKAVYRYIYKGIAMETELFVPAKGGDVVCSICFTNTAYKELSVEAFAQMFPLIAPVNLSGWDKPEWYVRTSVHHDKEKNLIFYGRLMNPQGFAAQRRNVSMLFGGEGVDCAEFLMDDYTGAGDFYIPDAFQREKWNYDFSVSLPFGEMGEKNSVAGFPAVYAAKYAFTLKKGESKSFTQVLSVLPSCGGEIPPETEIDLRKRYLSEKYRETAARRARGKWENLFALNGVHTGYGGFDDYVNGFLPLQMQWVSILDRGWPTGMRGTRDASNDFMGMLQWNSGFSKRILHHLFDCECKNGWLPRQVSENRKGPHDMRNYVDGGVFALEFLYEYICYTKDFAFLDETAGYSDSEKKESIEQHVLRVLAYYASADNIGDDGLCKIREGDWFDGVNRAGLGGKGESVTVSCQFFMAVRYMKKLFSMAGEKQIPAEVEIAAECAAEGVRRYAFNKTGFFNGLKNDEGKWIFSDNDPDGESRMYAVPNAFAVFSGVADEKQKKSVIRNFSRLKTDIGYKLFRPSFRQNIDGVGRIACGDVAEGLLGNSTVYNHGSQGFLCRACCAAGEADLADEVLRLLLPFDQTCHPEEETYSPPYAIVNCYQDVPPFKQRAGFAFLTGTVAMAVRIVYNFMFGIRPCAEGISISPCLTEKYNGAKIVYNYNGKMLRFIYKRSEKRKVTVNGKDCRHTVRDVLSEKVLPLIPEHLLIDGTEIEIYF